jgi:hypothetical protein
VPKKAAVAGICVFALSTLAFGQSRSPSRGRGSGAGRGTIPLTANDTKGIYATSEGVLKSISKSQLMVQTDDEHEMKFRITRKTKFVSQDQQGTHDIKASALESGQKVSVDAETALDGSFEAAKIVLVLAEPPKDSDKK